MQNFPCKYKHTPCTIRAVQPWRKSIYISVSQLLHSNTYFIALSVLKPLSLQTSPGSKCSFVVYMYLYFFSVCLDSMCLQAPGQQYLGPFIMESWEEMTLVSHCVLVVFHLQVQTNSQCSKNYTAEDQVTNSLK